MLKMAVTDSAEESGRVQGLGLLQPPPVQPMNREPRSALAVSFTIVPVTIGKLQSLLQAIVPRGVVMFTVPPPVPVFAMLSLVSPLRAAATSMRDLAIGLRVAR